MVSVLFNKRTKEIDTDNTDSIQPSIGTEIESHAIGILQIGQKS